MQLHPPFEHSMHDERQATANVMSRIKARACSIAADLHSLLHTSLPFLQVTRLPPETLPSLNPLLCHPNPLFMTIAGAFAHTYLHKEIRNEAPRAFAHCLAVATPVSSFPSSSTSSSSSSS